MNKTPREYQRDACAKACEKNTILQMPTGTGKTLVAAMYIKEMREKCNNKKPALFLVPTLELVRQQAVQLEEYLIGADVLPFGIDKAKSNRDKWRWTNEEWQDGLREFTAIVALPDPIKTFIQTLRYLKPDDFCCVVFDECHHGTQGHAYAKIAKDIHPEDGPRVLGLTASYIAGKFSRIVEKRKILEITLRATLYVPDIPPDFVNTQNFTVVPFVEGTPDVTVKTTMDTQLQEKKHTKVKEAAGYMLTHLGINGTRYFFQYVGGYGTTNNNAVMEVSEQQSQVIINAIDQLAPPPPPHSDKVEQLFSLLEDLFKRNPETRCLIFVERVVTTTTLAWLINMHKFEHPKIKANDGYGELKTLADHIQQFRDGTTPVLVATKAMEEGHDIGDCDCVIRFDAFELVKDHIQGAGRARKLGAQIYYFEADPDAFQSQAKDLEKVANQPTEVTNRDFQMHYEKTRQYIDSFHPYQHKDTKGNDGAQLSVLDAKTVFSAYISKTCTKIPNFMNLVIKWEGNDVTTVYYPTTEDWVAVTKEEVDEEWGERTVQSVVSKDEINNWKPKDVNESRFLYVVVKQMCQKHLVKSDLTFNKGKDHKIERVVNTWESKIDNSNNAKTKTLSSRLKASAPLGRTKPTTTSTQKPQPQQQQQPHTTTSYANHNTGHPSHVPHPQQAQPCASPPTNSTVITSPPPQGDPTPTIAKRNFRKVSQQQQQMQSGIFPLPSQETLVQATTPRSSVPTAPSPVPNPAAPQCVP